MTRRSAASRAGFTLIELLVAITILSGGLLALAGSMALVIRLEGSTERRVEMSTLGSDKIGEIDVSASRGTLPQPGGSLTSPVTGFSEEIQGVSGRRYLRRWTVEAGPVTRTFRVTVRVSPVGVNSWLELASLVFVP